MATLNDLSKKFGQADLKDLLDQALRESKHILLELVRVQIEHGETGIGEMPQYISESYARYKQSIGSKAPSGTIDLKLTGSFLDKLVLRINKNSILIRSTDSKNSDLLNTYGKEIFLLNDENLSFYVNEIIQPIMLRKLR